MLLARSRRLLGAVAALVALAALSGCVAYPGEYGSPGYGSGYHGGFGEGWRGGVVGQFEFFASEKLRDINAFKCL